MPLPVGMPGADFIEAPDMKYLSFRLLTVLLVAATSPASAELSLVPALYQVTGVASDDTLNIRTSPSAGSTKIGAFAHNKDKVEVIDVSPDGNWGLVNINGQSGWTSGRFLRLMPGQPADNLPANMVCSGTEPFWVLEFGPFDTARGDWSFMGLTDGATNYGAIWTDSPLNRTPNRFGFDFPHSRVSVTGFVQTGLCNDGMSDLEYGFSVGIILRTPSDRLLVDGCCSLTAPEY